MEILQEIERKKKLLLAMQLIIKDLNPKTDKLIISAQKSTLLCLEANITLLERIKERNVIKNSFK